MFFIESSEVCICPECNGELKYRDKAPRIQKQFGANLDNRQIIFCKPNR